MFSPSTRPSSPSELRSNSQWPLDSYPAARTTRHNWWFPLQVRVLIRRAGDVMVKICQTTQGLKQEKQTQGLNQRQTSEFSATKQRAVHWAGSKKRKAERGHPWELSAPSPKHWTYQVARSTAQDSFDHMITIW